MGLCIHVLEGMIIFLLTDINDSLHSRVHVTVLDDIVIE